MAVVLECKRFLSPRRRARASLDEHELVRHQLSRELLQRRDGRGRGIQKSDRGFDSSPSVRREGDGKGRGPFPHRLSPNGRRGRFACSIMNGLLERTGPVAARSFAAGVRQRRRRREVERRNNPGKLCRSIRPVERAAAVERVANDVDRPAAEPGRAGRNGEQSRIASSQPAAIRLPERSDCQIDRPASARRRSPAGTRPRERSGAAAQRPAVRRTWTPGGRAAQMRRRSVRSPSRSASTRGSP